jgi:hypothetical protein
MSKEKSKSIQCPNCLNTNRYLIKNMNHYNDVMLVTCKWCACTLKLKYILLITEIALTRMGE